MGTRENNEEAIESRYAWLRLAVSFVLMTIGGSGMYSISVVLPRIQWKRNCAVRGWITALWRRQFRTSLIA